MDQTSLVEFRLVREQRVVILPKLSLFLGAAGSFSRDLRLRMQRPHGKIQKGELYTAVIFGQQIFQRDLRFLAEGALEV